MGKFQDINSEATFDRFLDPVFLARQLYGTAGRIFWVKGGSHTDSDQAEFSALHPPYEDNIPSAYQSLDSAVGACRANRGDVIVVAAGDTISDTVAAAIVLDVAGIKVVGLGEGSNRPLITFSGASTADLDINANGITVENMRFDFTGVDALVAGIDVNADDFTMRNCHFLVSDSDGQATLGILSDTTLASDTNFSSRFTLDNCTFMGDTIVGTTAAVSIVGGVEHRIENCWFDGNYSVGAIEFKTSAPLRVLVKDNYIMNHLATAGAAIQSMTGLTGLFVKNNMAHNTSSLGDWIQTASNAHHIENYGSNVVGGSAILDIAAGASAT